MNIPPDDQNPPSAPLGLAPSGLPSDADLSLNKKGGSKVPLIVIGVLAVGGIGFMVMKSKKEHEERKQHAAFMESFMAFEKEDLMKFWACVLGPNTDGSIAPSPDSVTQKVDVMFASDFRNYPNKIKDDCSRAAKDAQLKVAGLAALPAYSTALDTYGKAILAMSEALDDWAKVAPEQVATKMVGKNVEDFGNIYHAFSGGTPGPEVIAYDAFLHCAEPDMMKHKDNLELAKHLFEQCKDAAYRDKLQNECGKLVSDEKPTAPSKDYKAVLAKFSAEDRDVQAFGDCLKKARKGKLKDNLAPVGMKWVAYREAREAVLKIGQEALKSSGE